MSKSSLSRRSFVQMAASVVAMGAASVFGDKSGLRAQTDSRNLPPVLKTRVQTPEVVEFQLREYLVNRIPKLPLPATAGQWTAETKRLRRFTLDAIYHGWPLQWINAQPKFEDLGLLKTGMGYRLRKLRYEVVPGLQSTALLYEPENVGGKVPATLNLNGHSPQGKGAEYKQKRCINNALRGMYALSLEWFFCGELQVPENAHWFGAHLNLVGFNAVGLHYLAMRRGLDYLCQHSQVDPKRIAVTGLSGGGWQTIMISSLDERVAATIPVSGYFPMMGALSRNGDVGDFEYNASEMRREVDYTHLTAMMAPRPTLLIYSTADEYVGRSQVMKPELYDPVKPFFKLYGKEDSFAFHENSFPGTHNYQLDNREASYEFLGKHFSIPGTAKEISVDSEVRSQEELAVGLPKNNHTLLSLARALGTQSSREHYPTDATAQVAWAETARDKLKSIVRYRPVSLKRPWAVDSTKHLGFSAISFRLEMSNELSATAVWIKTDLTPENAPTTLVLCDKGFATAQPKFCVDSVAFHTNRGHQVWATNPIFTADASPEQADTPLDFGPATLYSMLLDSIGERPLGMRVAQLTALAKWLQSERGVNSFFIDSTGIRSQVAALVAACVEPNLFSEILVRDGMNSLGYLLSKPVTLQEAPDLFCLDLYKHFDIDSLVALAKPSKITQQFEYMGCS